MRYSYVWVVVDFLRCLDIWLCRDLLLYFIVDHYLYLCLSLTFHAKMPVMKLKKLETNLESVDVFENPKIKLEQYATTPHIAGEKTATRQSRRTRVILSLTV